MTSEMHTTQIEADNAAVEPTGALKTASGSKPTIDEHVIAAVAGARGESPHVNGRSSRLNTTIIPFLDRREAFVMPRLPMVRPAKDLPGSAFTPILSIYQHQSGLRFTFCSSNSLERR